MKRHWPVTLPGRVRALAEAILITLGQAVSYDTVSTLAEHENLLVDRNQALWAVLCALLSAAILSMRRTPRKRDWGLIAFAAIFGFLSVCARSLYEWDSFVFLTKNAYQLGLSLVCMCSYAGLYLLAGEGLFLLLERGTLLDAARGAEQGTRAGRFAWRHVRLCAFVLILLCWLPWLAAFYPGVATWDMFCQLKAFFGSLPLIDDHPIVSTCIMGLCMKLGQALDHGNLGVLLYMLLQETVCAYAFAAVVDEMGRLGCRRAAQVCTVLFFALLPIWPMYARMGHKDFLFTGVCTLFTIEVTRAALRNREAFARPRDYVRMGVLALLTCLLRKNGIAVVLPCAALVPLCAFYGKRRLAACSALGGALAVYAAIQLALLPALGVGQSGGRELYSVPFQQTARYMRNNAGDVTDAQRLAVAGVLDAETIGDVYVPVLADPVKATFHAAHDASARGAYWRSWLAMGMADPTCYFAALLSLNYGYYVCAPRIWYNDSTGPCFWYDWEIIPQEWVDEFGLSMPDELGAARGALRAVAEGVEDVPLLGLLYQNALYSAVTWLGAWYLLKKKRGAALLAAVPSLCTLLLCFGMPVNACLRYFLPVMASAPLLLAAAACAGRAGSRDLTREIEATALTPPVGLR